MQRFSVALPWAKGLRIAPRVGMERYLTTRITVSPSTINSSPLKFDSKNRLSLLLGLISSCTTTTFCASNDKDDDNVLEKISKIISNVGDSKSLNAALDGMASSMGNELQAALDSGVPTQLSYGFISGYCSGLAMKKVGRAAAVVFGMGFVALQTLQYSGYIQVDHRKLQKDVEAVFDLDKDGSVDKDDIQMGYSKILSILQYNLPAGGGFGAGFLGGLRSG